MHPTMHTFAGKARCYNSEDAAMEAIRKLNNTLKPGENIVIVIRYEGPPQRRGM
ncbi:dihydroxy-acid dehydratase [Longimonas sp.]|uniref:dihydroxy-acid dehydratase domain-containing protein n=1 Tax=Longimonas sp. TaxID=2039626 RepID=UPI0039749912